MTLFTLHSFVIFHVVPRNSLSSLKRINLFRHIDTVRGLTDDYDTAVRKCQESITILVLYGRELYGLLQ